MLDHLYKRVCPLVGRSICYNFMKFSKNQPFSINQSQRKARRTCHDLYHHAVLPSYMRTHCWPYYSHLITYYPWREKYSARLAYPRTEMQRRNQNKLVGCENNHLRIISKLSNNIHREYLYKNDKVHFHLLHSYK